MKETGGYFELELKQGVGFHADALPLNTGRNCFEYILAANDYDRVYIPYYNCNALLEPLQKLQIEYEYYRIDTNLNPIFSKKLAKKEALLIVNYFGLKEKVSESFAGKYQNNLIIDNSQAFFAKPLDQIDTFYSTRKFFGVPDGGYLYTKKHLNKHFDLDVSYTRMEHLLRRIDVNAEDAYAKFVENENSLSGQPIKKMSKLTRALLCCIDYQRAKLIREKNFLYLHDNLKEINELSFPIEHLNGPMTYPMFITKKGLKKRLIEAKIFVASYWDSVLNLVEKNSFEYRFAEHLLPLPIDQRYDLADMEKIVKMLN